MAIKTTILHRNNVFIVHYHGMMMPWNYQPVCNTTRQTMELRVIFKTKVNIVNIWKLFSFTKRFKISMSSAVNYGSGIKITLNGCWPYKEDDPIYLYIGSGRIHLSVSTVNRTYEFSGGTQMTHFFRYGKHSIGPSTYGLWVRSYSMSSCNEPILVVSSYKGPSNAMCTYGTLARIRKYGLLYLRIVEYDNAYLRIAWSYTSGVKTMHAVCFPLAIVVCSIQWMVALW